MAKGVVKRKKTRSARKSNEWDLIKDNWGWQKAHYYIHYEIDSKQWLVKVKEYIKAKTKAYYEENKEACIERSNRYERERRRQDPTFRLLLNTNGAVYKALRRENGGKNGARTLDALPFTIDELKQHLENQFDEHMTWENYGSYWHVDHIYPLKLLPYDSLEHEHFKLVWDLRNLRPLEGRANSSKGGSIPNTIPEYIKLFLEKQSK